MTPVWVGRVEDCDVCHEYLKDVMYDANIRTFGMWGNICQRCFDYHRCRLGTGLGQKYERQSDGRWLKVGG